MVIFPYIKSHIKNILKTINSSIDKDEYMIGYKILNKLTEFIKKT